MEVLNTKSDEEKDEKVARLEAMIVRFVDAANRYGACNFGTAEYAFTDLALEAHHINGKSITEKWTHERPRQVGWYWYWMAQTMDEPVLRRVHTSPTEQYRDGLYVDDYYGMTLAEYPRRAWWQGPISIPKPPADFDTPESRQKYAERELMKQQHPKETRD